MRNKKLRLVIGGVVLSVFLSVFTNISTVNVSAASSADSIYKKTLLNAIKTCYNDTYMKKSVLGTDYSGPYSLMAGSQNWISTGTGSGGFKDGIIKVPSQYGNSLDDADMSCYQLFSGWREDKSTNSAKGLLALYGKTIPENKLPSIGYEKKEVSASGGYKQGCISLKYTAPNGSGGSATYETNQLCMDVDSDNKIDIYNNPPTVGDSKGGKISILSDANYVVNIYGPDGMFATTPHSLMAGGGESWDTFKSEFENAAKQIDGWVNMATSNNYGFHFNSVNANLGNEDHYSEYTRTQSGDTAATKALRYFAGSGKTWDSIKFNDEDRYTLYTAYIERYIKDSNYPSVYIGADSKCSSKLDDAKKETKYAYRKDKSTWCPLYGVEDGNVPKLNGIASGNTKLTPMDFKDIVKEMMKSKYDTYAAAEGTNNIGSADPGSDDENETEDASPCSEAGQSLGWIICPVVQLVSEATQGIYGYIESSYLQTNPDFISDDGTREAWGSFRSYANIIFAIVLAIIILSQITGFGVTNYGIKKMLPTIIVMAVLVNVSFFLCEVAVDLSNIVGYGAGKLFDGIAAGSDEGTVTLGGMVNGAAMTFLSGAGMVGGLALAYNTVEFWLLPFLLMILIAFVSVVVFFILLGVRQAGIIILITLAPLAIICYALPNTKKFFERWWKLFFSLLLVYPICGLLMSGGQFASRLLLNVGSSAEEGMRFSYAFVAILLQAVPFFFVPSILKSSFAAMGNIGNKLSMLGNRFSRGAAGAIRRSEGYKDAQARLAGHNAQRMLNREDWNNRHRVLGAAGRLKNRAGARIRSGNGRLAEMAKNSYNRKQERLQARNTEERLRNARAGFAADGNYDQRLNSRLDAEHERYINSMAEDIELANSNIATNDEVMGLRHAEALEALNADPNSDQNRAAVRAYQNMLNASGDGGRRTLFDNYAQNIQDHGGEIQTGTQMAAQHLIREHARDIKPKSRDFFGMLGDVSRGENKGTFQQFADNDGKQHWMSSEYGAKSVGGYDASSFAQADEGSINRLIAQARSGQLDESQRTQLEEYTRKALDGQHNIHAQGKVANKMNDLRDAMGFSRVSQDSGSTVSSTAGQADSSSIIIPRDNSPSVNAGSTASGSRNSAGTGDSATIQNIIRNPNGTIQGDIHADGLGTVRVQNGSTMTDSGIILPPRDAPRRQNNGPRQNNGS